MSFEERETSVEGGLPASLFLIEYGDTDSSYFAYTDFDQPVTFGNVTYLPIVIGREKIETSGSLDKSTLNIDITPNASVVALFQNSPPSHKVRLTIFQGHADDPDLDFKVVWTGRIIAIAKKQRFATISAEPISTALRRSGLRRHYQYGCPWVLYGQQCGVNSEDRKVTPVTTNVQGNYLEFADGWQDTWEKIKFQQGYIQWVEPQTLVTQTRTVLTVDPTLNRLIINGGLPGLVVGATVSVYLGCNHQMSDCNDLHGNIINFGGQPWIPKDNPTSYRNQYY